jgi:hypothetical protein
LNQKWLSTKTRRPARNRKIHPDLLSCPDAGAALAEDDAEEEADVEGDGTIPVQLLQPLNLHKSPRSPARNQRLLSRVPVRATSSQPV